jgi:hypothetical protein
MDAARVPTPAVRIALTSGMGELDAWLPQDDRRSANNSNRIENLRAVFIFTSA